MERKRVCSTGNKCRSGILKFTIPIKKDPTNQGFSQISQVLGLSSGQDTIKVCIIKEIRKCINCESTLESLMADQAPPMMAEEILPNDRYEDGWQVYVEQHNDNVDNLESPPQDVLNWFRQAVFNIIPTDLIQEIDKILDENPRSWEEKAYSYLQSFSRVEQLTNLGPKVVVENEPPFILHPDQLSSMNADYYLR